MSIHSASAKLASLGLNHTVVASVSVDDSALGLEVAIASGRIKSFDGLVEELETAEDVKYANRYKKWAEKGRTGTPPKSKGKVRTAMFIRSVCHTLGI
jgi:hypothetical protein